ncbi:MAG: hypothetical protein ABI647_12685 [Gemmatimonadota bacterium]
MVASDWSPVFAYLEQESNFQAAAAAATGAAAAWWLKALLAPAPSTTQEQPPFVAKVAAALLALTSFLFLVAQGDAARKYGELALMVATGQTVGPDWRNGLVRNVHSWDAIAGSYPYYAARALLLVVGVLVLWLLFSRRRAVVVR